MRIKEFFAAVLEFSVMVYHLLFHKRNIIIVSERKVKHVPVSGLLQLSMAVFVVTVICLVSYSTGSYFAARSALKEQTQTLKSVVEDRVETNFSVLNNAADTKAAISSKANFGAVDHTELYARIVELETKLKTAEESKKSFIEKIQKRTAKNIDSYETLIEQTGLDLDTLKSRVPSQSGQKEAVEKSTPADAQGGPYVPDDVSDLKNKEHEVFSNLDELSVLTQIVENLPVRKPILGYKEMSQFGRRIDPFTGRLAVHSGLDMAGPAGSKIYATSNGKVSFTGRQGAYGNMIDIDHGFDISTRYAHLSQILVEDGETVKKGQVIGIQGSTGRSTGAHLHYEVRYKDQPLNPKNFLAAGRYVQKS